MIRTRIFVTRTGSWLVVVVASILAGASFVGAVQEQAQENFRESPFLRVDPDRVVVSSRDPRIPCGECHVSEYLVWQETAHATGFNTMHRTPTAQGILDAMGLNVAKRQESLCMRCHYTVNPDRKAAAGVSCESCHGPARDWIDLHTAVGLGVERKDQESAEHRRARVEDSEAAGMLSPSGDVYAVAANCFECHTVPFEKLVNTGGHGAGSRSFDLLEKAERIRHNFVHQQWDDDSGNRESTRERQRVMFVVGRILAYEFGIRGMAVATEDAVYSRSTERRVKEAFLALEELALTTSIAEVTEILTIAADLDLVPNNEISLAAAADQIRSLGQRFSTSNDGSTLGPVDALVAGGAAPPPDDPAPDTSPVGGRPATTSQTTEAPGTAAAPVATTGGSGTASATEPVAEAGPPNLPGRIRSRPEWFAESTHATTVPDCAKCHAQADDWLYDDPHQTTHKRLVNKDPAAVVIATLYGLSGSEMSLGNRICMSCHGTAKTASPAVAVRDGVGCESCHGGSEAFLEPHETAGVDPFALGMTRLKDASERAATCSRCHLITDERLLAAGHSSGSDYDFVQANASIEHFPDRRIWRTREGEYQAAGDAELASSYRAILGARAIPSVSVVSLPTPSIVAPSLRRPLPTENALGSTTGEPTRHLEPAARPVEPDEVRTGAEPSWNSTPPRPAARVARAVRQSGGGGGGGIQPMPASTDEMSTEDLLLLVKRRLDRLYRIVGSN